MVYLFVGGDPLSKDIKLAKIKEEFLTPDTQDFNLDVIYAKETDLRNLQEKVLTLPVKAKKRIIVVKDAHCLKDDMREFIFKFAGAKEFFDHPHP